MTPVFFMVLCLSLATQSLRSETLSLQVSPDSVISCPKDVSKRGMPYFGCSLMFYSQNDSEFNMIGEGPDNGSLLFVGAPHATFNKVDGAGCMAVFDLQSNKLLTVYGAPSPMPFYRARRNRKTFKNMGFASNFSASPNGQWILIGALNGGQAYMLEVNTSKWHTISDPLMQVRDGLGKNNLTRTNYGVKGVFLDNRTFMITGRQLTERSIQKSLVPGILVFPGEIDPTGNPRISSMLKKPQEKYFKLSDREESEGFEYWRKKGNLTNLASYRHIPNFCSKPAISGGYGRVIAKQSGHSSFLPVGVVVSQKYNYYAGHGTWKSPANGSGSGGQETTLIAIDLAGPTPSPVYSMEWAFRDGSTEMKRRQLDSRVLINPLENFDPTSAAGNRPRYQILNFGALDTDKGLFWLAIDGSQGDRDFLLLVNLRDRRLVQRIRVDLKNSKGEHLEWGKRLEPMWSLSRDTLLRGSEDGIAYDLQSGILAVGRTGHGDPDSRKQAMGAVLLYNLKIAVEKLQPDDSN